MRRKTRSEVEETRSRIKEEVAGRDRGLGRVVGLIVVEMRGKDWD